MLLIFCLLNKNTNNFLGSGNRPLHPCLATALVGYNTVKFGYIELSYDELGYNELGYNEHFVTKDKIFSLKWPFYYKNNPIVTNPSYT